MRVESCVAGGSSENNHLFAAGTSRRLSERRFGSSEGLIYSRHSRTGVYGGNDPGFGMTLSVMILCSRDKFIREEKSFVIRRQHFVTYVVASLGSWLEFRFFARRLLCGSRNKVRRTPLETRNQVVSSMIVGKEKTKTKTDFVTFPDRSSKHYTLDYYTIASLQSTWIGWEVIYPRSREKKQQDGIATTGSNALHGSVSVDA